VIAGARNQSGRRLLLRCFTTEELEYLHRQLEFTKGFQTMQTLTEFENLVTLGNRLLIERVFESKSARSSRT
jgi:hypothetical protein